MLSLGWQGTDNQWRHYSRAYLYLAALATPLVLSVHSVVSWDFAMLARARAGTGRSSPRTSWPAPSTPASAWCSRCSSRSGKHLQARAHDHRLPLRQPGEADAASPARSCSTPTAWSTSSPGTAATPSSRPPSSAARSGPMWWAGWTMIICNALRVAAALVPEDPDQPHGAVRHLDLHQHRDVVRALRDHRLVAEQRLHPVGLGPASTPPGPTGASWPARSAGSGCGSCSSPRTSRSWRSRRSRR